MTKIVGIVNVTPDSFSDGGRFSSSDHVVAFIHELVAQGAEIIDIGAESTRPGAKPLNPKEEWQRLQPVLAELHGKPFTVSVDTRYASTAKKALDYGVSWINDVSGFSDLEMISVIKDADVDCVVMHSLSVPADKHVVLPEEVSVVDEVLAWAQEKIRALEASGVDKSRIIIDPGIGFGKTAKQSWELLQNIEVFTDFGVRVLVGHSRKSFLSKVKHNDFSQRDKETLEISLVLQEKGVDYVRVHDVHAHKAAFEVIKEIAG